MEPTLCEEVVDYADCIDHEIARKRSEDGCGLSAPVHVMRYNCRQLMLDLSPSEGVV